MAETRTTKSGKPRKPTNWKTRPKKVTDLLLKASLKKHHCMYGPVARELGVTWHAIRYRCEKPEMQEFIADLMRVDERTLDEAESNVAIAVRERDMVTSRWLLERKGASRGYRLGDEGPPPPPPPQVDRDRHKTIINILVQNLDGRVRAGRLDAAAEAVGISPSEYRPEPRAMLTNGNGAAKPNGNGHAAGSTVAAALLAARRKTNGHG